MFVQPMGAQISLSWLLLSEISPRNRGRTEVFQGSVKDKNTTLFESYLPWLLYPP